MSGFECSGCGVYESLFFPLILSCPQLGGAAMGTADELSGRLQILLDRFQTGDETARAELIGHSCERLQSLAAR